VFSTLPPGEIPLKSTADISLTIRNEATPIFSELYYSVSAPESIPVHSAIITIEAKSPKGRKLIYSISDGDIYGEFGVQFETGLYH
jgi:protocadherin Fat 1/2/3